MRIILLCCLASTSIATAQSVGLAAITPIAVTVQAGGQTNTATLPLGPVVLPSITVATAPAPFSGSGDAGIVWTSTITPSGMTVECRQNVYAGLAAVQTSIGPHDWIVQMSAPQPVAVQLSVYRVATILIGTVSQSLEVDVRADGHVEYSLATGGEWNENLTLGPTPLLIRVQGDMSATGPALAQSTLIVTARPQAGIVSTEAMLGCDPRTQLVAWPQFDGNLLLRRHDSQTVFGSVFVLGFAAQPVFLAPATPFPCLLLPTPDLLLLVPGQDLLVPLPPAVRPVTFFAQTVQFDSLQLMTSNSLLLSAY